MLEGVSPSLAVWKPPPYKQLHVIYTTKIKMSNWGFWVWACLAAWCATVGAAQPMPADAMARPARPKTFDSPDDLRTYLNQLGQYYAVAGRPRFGKRTFGPRIHLPAIEGLNSYRYPLNDPSELYELLYPQAD